MYRPLLSRFSEDARSAVARASYESRALNHPQTGAEHLLLGIVTTPSRVGALIAGCGLREDAIRKIAFESYVADPSRTAMAELSPSAIAVLASAAASAHGRLVTVVDLWVAATEHEAGGAVLAKLGVSRETVARVISHAVEDARSGTASAPLVIRINDEALGDLGHPHVDASLLHAILARQGRVATWLGQHGITIESLRAQFQSQSDYSED